MAMLNTAVEVNLELVSEDFLITVGVTAYIEVCGQEAHPGIWWVFPKPHMMTWKWFASRGIDRFDGGSFLAQVTVVGVTLELYWYT